MDSTNMPERVLRGAGIMHVVWSPDGRYLATDDRIWDTTTWEIHVAASARPPFPHRFAFSRDGDLFYKFFPGKKVHVEEWDVAAGHKVRNYELFHDMKTVSSYSIAIDPLWRYFTTIDRSALVIYFFDTTTGKIVPGKEIHAPDSTKISSVSFSPDGRLLYVMIYLQARFLVVDVENCEVREDVTFIDDALSEEGPWTQAESDAWDARDYDNPTIKERVGGWSRPFISLNGKWMALESTNSSTYFLARQAGTWRLVHRLLGIKTRWDKELHGGIQGSGWSPDSRFYARAHERDPSTMGYVSLVEATSGTWQVTGVFPHESGGVNDVAFSPDSRRFASIEGDAYHGGNCYIWSHG